MQEAAALGKKKDGADIVHEYGKIAAMFTGSLDRYGTIYDESWYPSTRCSCRYVETQQHCAFSVILNMK